MDSRRLSPHGNSPPSRFSLALCLSRPSSATAFRSAWVCTPVRLVLSALPRCHLWAIPWPKSPLHCPLRQHTRGSGPLLRPPHSPSLILQRVFRSTLSMEGADDFQRERICTAFGTFLAGFRVEISHAHTYQFSLLIWSPKPGVSMTVSFILTPPSSITGELTEKAPKRSLFRVMPGAPLPTSQGDPGSFLLQDQLLEKSSSRSSPPQHLCSCCSLYLKYPSYFFLPKSHPFFCIQLKPHLIPLLDAECKMAAP